MLEGSPPRVRGKHAGIIPRARELRITPARAGKTKFFVGFAFRQRDHPRACGENVMATGGAPMGTGSPPRVRGKH